MELSSQALVIRLFFFLGHNGVNEASDYWLVIILATVSQKSDQLLTDLRPCT